MEVEGHQGIIYVSSLWACRKKGDIRARPQRQMGTEQQGRVRWDQRERQVDQIAAGRREVSTKFYKENRGAE